MTNYNEVLYEYINLYKHQPPRQAELIVPQWALDRLNELPEEQRRNILYEIDQIAAGNGLLTPTKIIVIEPVIGTVMTDDRLDKLPWVHFDTPGPGQPGDASDAT